METTLGICERCVTAVNDAARQSYRDGENDCCYGGCSAEVSLSPDTRICVTHDPRTGFSVEACHPSNQETPNLDNAITGWLDENADPEAEWQEAYDGDDHDRQAALDAGFGSWQDYYDFMY